MAAHRDRTRQKRKDSQVFQMGLIGYTNAGKSTILNILTSADTYEQDQLFATLDPLTKRWRMPEGFEVTITDTVGFIQELPTQLIDAFHSTLEESQNMDFFFACRRCQFRRTGSARGDRLEVNGRTFFDPITDVDGL